MASWILGGSGSNDVKGKHVAHWLSISGLLNLSVGSVSTFQNSCGLLLNSDLNFRLIFKTQTKSIHHCHNNPPTRHSEQSLPILTLAFAFFNNLPAKLDNLKIYCIEFIK